MIEMKKKFRALKRSALSLLLALTMTLSFLPAYAQAEGEENLLTNGDFETVDIRLDSQCWRTEVWGTWQSRLPDNR